MRAVMSKKRVIEDFSFEGGDIIDKVIREEESISTFRQTQYDATLNVLSLQEINDYFQKRLYELKESEHILSRLGLTNKEVIRLFKAGFIDGSIKDVVSVRQRKCLDELGITDLKDCITFPVLSNEGEVISILCVDMNLNVKIVGDSKGIFNLCSIKVYDEPIFTESILSAIGLLGLGILNVVYVPNIEVFCSNHLKTLRDFRVKNVVIAFDNVVNSDLFKDILLVDNFNVKQISPPLSDSWSIAISKGLDKSMTDSLISEAKSYPETKETGNIKVKKEGSTYIFTLNDIVYRLIDVKEMFVTALKVNIKAEYGQEKFPDRIDFYSSRSRNTYSLTLAKAFNIEPKRIEKDLLSILDYLESERDKKLSESNNGLQPVVLTEEERKLGLEFLHSKTLFDDIVFDMSLIGYVGEDLNKQLIYYVLLQES